MTADAGEQRGESSFVPTSLDMMRCNAVDIRSLRVAPAKNGCYPLSFASGKHTGETKLTDDDDGWMTILLHCAACRTVLIPERGHGVSGDPSWAED